MGRQRSERSWKSGGPPDCLVAKFENLNFKPLIGYPRFGSVLFHQALSEEWITKHTKPCPQCRTAIEKNLGCNHMTCKKCSYQWCWLCNATYTPGHYQRTACEQFGDEYFQELGITREMYYERFF
jgi:IBR domain, a half RING-finger domain